MPPVTADEIIKEIRDLHSRMQDDTKTLNERIAENEAVAKQIQEDIQSFKRQFVGPGAPMAPDQGRAATQRGGLFEGRFKVDYQRMLTLSARNPALLARDAERLTAIHDLHDACVVHFFAAVNKNPRRSQQEIVREIAKKTDFQLYAAQLADAGYERAANEILNPQADVGANLDFTLLSSQMIDLVRVSAIVGSQFPSIPLTRAKQDFPALRADTKSVLGGGLTTYAVPSSDPANVGAYPQSTMLQKPTLGQVAFDCIHNLGAIAWTDDMVEDSVVPFLPMMREQGAIMIARGRDAAIINGDDTGTHMDSDVTNAYDIRKAWDGLRKLGENYEATITNPITSGDFNTLMQKMGKFAMNPSNLVMFLNVIDWLILASDTSLKTVETIGIDRATLRVGVANQVFGVDIVLTEEIRRNLNTGGVYDGVTTNNTIEIMCNRTRFWNGIMHDARVEYVRVPQALGQWLQVDVREDFQAIDKNDTDNVFVAGSVAPVAIAVDVTA